MAAASGGPSQENTAGVSNGPHWSLQPDFPWMTSVGSLTWFLERVCCWFVLQQNSCRGTPACPAHKPRPPRFATCPVSLQILFLYEDPVTLGLVLLHWDA